MHYKLTLLLSITLLSYNNVIAYQNTMPTIDPIEDVSTKPNNDTRFIPLSGITAGGEDDQATTISARSNNHNLIESMEVIQTSNGRAYIQYRLQPRTTGTAIITVKVKDNGTPAAETAQSFSISVEERMPETAQKITAMPDNKTVLKAWPNPCLTTTLISFSIPQSEQYTTLDMYTLSGTKIQTLFGGKTNAGQMYNIPINKDKIPGGLYIIRLADSHQTKILKLIMVN